MKREERPSFFGFTATRPVAITMVVLAAAVFGLVGLARLPVNLLPDISYPTVTVRTQYEGASPQDVEERVSEKVQELLAVVPGVRRIYSVSRPGVSDVILEFTWGTEMVFAVSDIRERLDRFFPPAGAGRPLVLRYDPSLDPVMTLGITGEQSLVELRRYADLELEESLAQIEGVAAVKLRGGDEEEIRIAIDEAALTARGLDVALIGQRLAAENMNAASGSIEEGKTEFLVRALNEYGSLKEIEDTILVRQGDISVRLGEVADVRRVPADPEVISRIRGRPCVLVDIYKEAGANVVDLCRRVRERMFGTAWQQRSVAQGLHEAPIAGELYEDNLARQAELRRRRQMTDYLAFDMARYGMGVELLYDQSTFIQDSVNDVLQSAVLGGLFAVLVIFFFLRRFRTTAILAVSIPISLVATFAPMFLSGIDLNIMSLGGLALGVGMLVDNSIVVLESIARMREQGLSRRDAAVEGVRRVASAVTASTLTTVAVFFPIVFVEGVAGQLFRDQALTVVYALLTSLLVALFVIPMLASRGQGGAAAGQPPASLRPAWIAAGRPQAGGLAAPLAWALWALAVPFRAIGFLGTHVLLLGLRGLLGSGAGLGWLLGRALAPLVAGFQALYGAVDRRYPRFLARALAHRGLVLLVTGLLALAAALRFSSLGTEILPQVHQGEMWVEAFLPRDATVERTDEVMSRIEAAIAGLPDVERTFLASGVDPEELNSSDQGKHSARVLVTMRPDPDRVAQEDRVRQQIRELIEREPEIQDFRFAQSSVLSFNAPLVVEVIGHDLLDLRRTCDEVAGILRGIPSLRDVRSTLQRGNPELSIKLDRDKLAALDLDADQVTRILRTKILGEVPTLFAERERKIDIRVRIDREELDSVRRLEQLNVNPGGYPPIPLASVAEIRRREGPSEIRRLGNVRGAEVQASLHGFSLGSTQLMVEHALSTLSPPRGIEVRLGGQKDDLERSQQSLRLALLLAVFLVYIVMASQFESMVQPLVILLSVPLAMIGVVFALDALGIDLSVIVFLGAIVLAGIVVNNAIVLIDQVNRLRAEGLPKAEAIVRGAHTRLRPVLMTTLTTVLGLLPLTGWLATLPVLGGNAEGLELRAPMAVTVIAGLTCSTLLTLVVVPVVYSFSDRRR